MRGALIVGVLAAGCSEPATTIVLHTGPGLVAIDRGWGWEVLPSQEDFEVEVGGPFTLVAPCGYLDTQIVHVWNATVADREEWWIPCRQPGGGDPEMTVSTSSGRVQVSAGRGYASVSGDDPTQVMPVERGKSDLLALDDDGARYLLERDLALIADFWRDLDVRNDGRPTVEQPIVLPEGIDPSELRVRVSIELERARLYHVDLDEDPSSAPVLPADVLRSSDTQLVTVEWDRGDVLRWATGEARGAPFEVDFPGPIPSVDYAMNGALPEARFDDDPSWRVRTFLAMRPNGGGFDAWELVQYAGWHEAAGEDGLLRFPDVTTIPGWDPTFELADFGGRLELATGAADEPHAGIGVW